MLEKKDNLILNALIRQDSLGWKLCALASGDAWNYSMDSTSLCTAMGVPVSRRASLSRLLKELTTLGLIEKRGRDWIPNAKINFGLWAARVEGAITFKTEYEATNSVEVVLSRPLEPSMFSQRLMNSLRADWGLLDTESIIPDVARAAKERAVIVSPFIDDFGMTQVINFFQQTTAPNKHLIYRSDKAGVREAIKVAQVELNELGVQLYCYHVPLPDQGNESFHAKILLADRHTALVGSSNMTKWSMRYSLELGIKVRGAAANRVADVIDAMLASCQ